MAKRLTLIDLLDQMAPQVRDAFLESIARVVGDNAIQALEDAIRARDVNAVLALLDLDRGYFAPLDRAMLDTFEAGGEFAMAEFMRQARAAGNNAFRAAFNARNPAAERWLKQASSRLITEILDDQRQAIRLALAESLARGDGPRRTALDLVGRVNLATGRREGGLIGLTTGELETANRALAELLEGNTAYFRRKLRDRRFDRTVMKYLKDGKPVPADQARKIVGRYRDGLLRNRGERIARTEILGSLHASQDEALSQLVQSGKVKQEHIEEEWDAANDSDTRPSHAAMDGQKRKHGEPFVSGDGYQMLHPGDRSLGAPAKEIINCRCRKKIRIDWIAGLRDQLSADELAEARRALA